MIPTDLEAALEQIAAKDNSINAFRRIDSDSARAHVANVSESAPLAGVPFAVKELFDVAGHTTLAGSIIEEGRPPAEQDATVVARCRDAGAVLVGTTNMDEYAFGFTTENTHRGPTRNPHDLERIAGGSSGGSAAAVAYGKVPVAFGYDTNGSIRVPAALCGVYGHKPTFGRVSRAGARLFSPSLDHVGPFAADPALLAAVDRVVVGLLDRRDALVGVTAQSGEDLAGLLGVDQRFGGLSLHEVHQREPVRARDDQGVVRVAHHAGQLRLEDVVEDRDDRVGRDDRFHQRGP